MKTVYDRLGRVTQTTDQNGTVHQFEYDSAGRFYADKVTTLGTNIDGAVRRIEKTYDDLSRVQYVTSRSGTASDRASSTAPSNNDKQYSYDEIDRLSLHKLGTQKLMNGSDQVRISQPLADFH